MSEEEKTLITLWDMNIEDMERYELETELRVQKWLWRVIQRAWTKLVAEDQKKKPSRMRYDKIEFCEMYMKNLEALIAQIQHFIPRRTYADERRPTEHQARRRERAERDRNRSRDLQSKYNAADFARREGISLQWNKDLFIHVARDRGYQTEEAVVYAVEKELGLDRAKATLLINSGRFSWGQVMCIGAMLQMTPREFCDVFMAGYFEEYKGEWYASYNSIDKSALLRHKILPK